MGRRERARSRLAVPGEGGRPGAAVEELQTVVNRKKWSRHFTFRNHQSECYWNVWTRYCTYDNGKRNYTKQLYYNILKLMDKVLAARYFYSLQAVNINKLIYLKNKSEPRKSCLYFFAKMQQFNSWTNAAELDSPFIDWNDVVHFVIVQDFTNLWRSMTCPLTRAPLLVLSGLFTPSCILSTSKKTKILPI